jgi:CRISPR-associated protein Cmr5
MSRSGMEQGRAAAAYKYAEAGAKLTKNSEYKAYVKKLPMLIKTNGLGAAMSFAFAKAKCKEVESFDNKEKIEQGSNPWALIYSQIQGWLKSDNVLFLELSHDKNLMKTLTETDSPTYRAATIEVLALLNWMRRFAEGLICVKTEKEINNE